MPDDNNPGGGNNEAGGNGEAKEGAEKDSVSTPETIEALLESSAARARISFDDHVKLGQRAMQRLVDPSSVKGSLADDAQEVLGLLARDAMLAVDTWTRFLYLSSKKAE